MEETEEQRGTAEEGTGERRGAPFAVPLRVAERPAPSATNRIPAMLELVVESETAKAPPPEVYGRRNKRGGGCRHRMYKGEAATREKDRAGVSREFPSPEKAVAAGKADTSLWQNLKT